MIIGPIDLQTWNLLRQINSSLMWMRKSRDPRWNSFIETSSKTYQEVKQRYVT